MYQDIIDFLNAYKQVDYQPIKEKIRELRKSKGLQPKDFEERVGMSSKQYAQVEKPSCKSRPSLESLIKICEVLEVPLEYLLNTPIDDILNPPTKVIPKAKTASKKVATKTTGSSVKKLKKRKK